MQNLTQLSVLNRYSKVNLNKDYYKNATLTGGFLIKSNMNKNILKTFKCYSKWKALINFNGCDKLTKPEIYKCAVFLENLEYMVESNVEAKIFHTESAKVLIPYARRRFKLLVTKHQTSKNVYAAVHSAVFSTNVYFLLSPSLPDLHSDHIYDMLDSALEV